MPKVNQVFPIPVAKELNRLFFEEIGHSNYSLLEH